MAASRRMRRCCTNSNCWTSSRQRRQSSRNRARRFQIDWAELGPSSLRQPSCPGRRRGGCACGRSRRRHADVPRGRFYKINEPMSSLVVWARSLMAQGAPLCKRVGGRFGFELRLVVQGGLRILEKIEIQGFDTSINRPKITKWDAPLIFWRAILM